MYHGKPEYNVAEIIAMYSAAIKCNGPRVGCQKLRRKYHNHNQINYADNHHVDKMHFAQSKEHKMEKKYIGPEFHLCDRPIHTVYNASRSKKNDLRRYYSNSELFLKKD